MTAISEHLDKGDLISTIGQAMENRPDFVNEEDHDEFVADVFLRWLDQNVEHPSTHGMCPVWMDASEGGLLGATMITTHSAMHDMAEPLFLVKQ